jgi:hypothetical protein
MSEYMQPHNDIDTRKEKDCEMMSQHYFVHQKSTWTALITNPGFRDEKPATGRLRCDTD